MQLSDAQALENLATRIISEELKGKEAMTELRNYSGAEPPAAHVVHLLYHFGSDADIRAADPDYGREQVQRLAAALASMRESAR